MILLVTCQKNVSVQITFLHQIRFSVKTVLGNVCHSFPNISLFLGKEVELVSKELNHLMAILHVYAVSLKFMK